MPLDWLDGAPGTPGFYPIREGEMWITYRGHAHRDPNVEAKNERYEVITTIQGAVLRDLQREKYAWIFVYEGDRRERAPNA